MVLKQWRLRLLCMVLFCATVIGTALPSVSDDYTTRRITTGARLFRALLAADMHITEKASHANTLDICLLYIDDTDNARHAAETLESRDDARIRDMEVAINLVPIDEFVQRNGGACAGVFLTQKLTADQLQAVISIVNAQRHVLFSPLEGDVERGVHGGISVEAQVRPYLNMGALQDAGVELKSFFMRVAKVYEE